MSVLNFVICGVNGGLEHRTYSLVAQFGNVVNTKTKWSVVNSSSDVNVMVGCQGGRTDGGVGRVSDTL